MSRQQPDGWPVRRDRFCAAERLSSSRSGCSPMVVQVRMNCRVQSQVSPVLELKRLQHLRLEDGPGQRVIGIRSVRVLCRVLPQERFVVAQPSLLLGSPLGGQRRPGAADERTTSGQEARATRKSRPRFDSIRAQSLEEGS